MYFYEIKCKCEYDEWYRYIYITSPFAFRSLKDACGNKVPEKVKLLMDDRYLYPVKIRVLNAMDYFYCKYAKKYFHSGSRLDWEKEIL